MTSQAEKDWEEFQWGLQGVSTGSMYNQMGKDSRLKHPDSSYGAKSRSKPRKPQKIKQAAKKRVKAKKVQETGFSFLFAVITFVVIGLSLYKPESGNEAGTMVVAGVCSLIAGKWYKFIIISGIVIFIALAFSQK